MMMTEGAARNTTFSGIAFDLQFLLLCFLLYNQILNSSIPKVHSRFSHAARHRLDGSCDRAFVTTAVSGS
jgi:hypothetical protein